MSDDLVKELRAYDRPHQYLTNQPKEVSDAALNFALTLKRYEMTDAIVAGVGYVPVGKIKEAAERIEALEREVQTLKATQDDEALTAAWMAGSASRNDEVRALEAVVKEARWLIERTPVGKLMVAAGVADKLAALNAQKDKDDA